MTGRRRQYAMRGDLALVPSEILVQMLALGRVDGCLRLTRRTQRCCVYLRAGRITLAQLESVRGRRTPTGSATLPVRERVCDALRVALGWRDGSFTFERDVCPERGAETLDAEPQELLLDCLSRVGPKGGDEDGRA